MKGRRIAAGAAGAAAAVFGAGVGELAAAIIAPGASPVAAIGSALIDLAPPWAKNAAIALFGTNDKIALIIGISIVLVAVAAGAGLLELWRPPWGRVVMAAFGAVGILAAMTRADAGALDWIPSALAGVAAVFALGLLMKRIPAPAAARVAVPAMAGGALPTTVPLEPPATAAAASVSSEESAIDRRTFLAWTIGAAAVGVLAAVGGTVLRAGSRAASSVREALHLPAPAVTAPPVPAGAELGIPGLAQVITPNDAFYRIDTALIVPDIDPADWSLRIHGMVDNEVTLTWDELLALPLEESITTLTCVSNPVGGDLIGNALWLGYPIRELLKRAGPQADADMVLSTSIDGFTASTPLEVLTDDRNAILAVGMNGEPLPVAHGFPVRMVVPGLYGYVSATKWVTELEVTRFDQAAAYWTESRLVREGADQAAVADRCAAAGSGAERRRDRHRGRRLAAARRHLEGRGAGRRRLMAARRRSPRRSPTTPGCSGASRGPPRPAATRSAAARRTPRARRRPRSTPGPSPTARPAGSS